MIAFMKRYEQNVQVAFGNETRKDKLSALLVIHEKHIAWMQHERLVHLIVTLFVGLFMLLAFGLSVLRPGIFLFLLTGIFLVLELFYLVHYFRLENRIQGWYGLADTLRRKIDSAGD